MSNQPMTAEQILQGCREGAYRYSIERTTKAFIFYHVNTGRLENGEVIRVHKSQAIN